MTQTDPPPEGASREDLFRATLSQLVDGIVVLDRDGRLQMLNAAAEEVLGVNVHGIPHDQWPAHFGIYRPDGVTLCPVEELPLLRALKGEEVRDAEYVLRNAARPEPRRFSVTGSPLRDGAGAIVGSICLFRDITARRRDENDRARRLAALLLLTRREPVGPEGLDAELGHLVRGAATALSVGRVGLWRFTPDHSAIRCVAAYDGVRGASDAEGTLHASRYPRYFEALHESTVVAAGDAAADPRTKDLLADYLGPNRIGALLDAPVFVRGELDGVLCHEHRGGARTWTAEEETFAVAIANLAARAVAEAERLQLRDALRASEEARHQLEERSGTRTRLAGLIGRSGALREVFRRLRLAADSTVTVLLTGESGTGKELAAAAVHSLSARKNGPFIAVNCSAIPEPLLESELFGHVRGAFSGAERERTGLFQAAHGGTLFLDEVGDLPATLQVKVLRALQEREIRKVGDNRASKIDVRVIAATNRDLSAMIADGRLREDFYYRIRVFEIALPPLRERREDIPLLAAKFVGEFARSTGKRIKTVSPSAMRRLLEHPWPGNVRELRNALEHAFVLANGSALNLGDLPPDVAASPRVLSSGAAPAGDSVERERIRKALLKSGGNRTRASQSLGISRVTLWHKMKQYGIEA